MSMITRFFYMQVFLGLGSITAWAFTEYMAEDLGRGNLRFFLS